MTDIKKEKEKSNRIDFLNVKDYMENPLAAFKKLIGSPIVKFIFTGFINTVHNALWLYLFDKQLRINYSLAFTLAFIIAMVGSFFLNSYFTFKTRPTIKKFLQFPITVLPNYLISIIGQRILVEKLNWDSYISGLLASLIAIPLTFLVTRYILTKNDVKRVDAVEDINYSFKEEGTKALDKKKDRKNISNYFYNFGNLAKDDPWLDKWDIVIFLIIIAFSLLDHRYILRSDYLFGVKNTDSTVQMIYFLPFLIKDFILGGQSWSWSYGMGGDIFSEFSYYYTTSPLIWLIAPFLKVFPKDIWSLENSLVLKLFISIFKQVLFMIFMYILQRYEKRSKGASLASAMIYGGGLYYLWNANYFDFMTDAYLWVPLMVLGMRIYQKRRNFWPLLISASLAVINNYYFGFHTFVFFIFFALIMIIPEGDSLITRIKNWFSQLLSYGLIGLGSVLLSAFVFIPAFKAFIKIDRFDVNYIPGAWHGMQFIKELPIKLFFNGSSIGVPMLVILIFFINYRKTRTLQDRKVILLILTTILYLTPMTGYFLNGLNYYSERWFYLFIFVLAYASGDLIDEMKRDNNFNPWALIFLVISSGLLIYTNWDSLKDFKEKDLYSIILVANLLSFIIIAARHTLYKIKRRKALDPIIIICVALVMMANSEALGRDTAFDMNRETMKKEKMVSPDLEAVMSHVVPGPNEFYRTVFRNNSYENAPTYFRYYGISTFSSMTDGNMHIWLKKVLQIRHNITYLSSFMNTDDRIYLEGLLGVRYIITDKATNYIPPHQYVPVKEVNDTNKTYNLYENKNYVGLDMWFTNTYPEDEVKKLPLISDRDLQLLNYAIVSEPLDGFNNGKTINSEEIPLDDKTMILSNVDHTIESQDIDGSTITNEYFKFNKGGFVTFNIPNPTDNSQVYLQNFVRPDDRQGFEQTINNKRIYKAEEDNVYVYSINDWSWAFNGAEKNLVWKTADKKYQVEKMHLSRVNLDNFDDIIKERNKYNMENLEVGKDSIRGTVNNKERGIMVFNIPYNKGWSLKVNGKATEIKRMNGFLSGVVLEPGENKLSFTFRPDGLNLGAAISLVTLLVSFLVHFIMRKKKLFITQDPTLEKVTLSYKELYTNESENYGALALKNTIVKEVSEKLRTHGANLYPIDEKISPSLEIRKEDILEKAFEKEKGKVIEAYKDEGKREKILSFGKNHKKDRKYIFKNRKGF